MPAAPDHWEPVAADLITYALGLTERARRCVVAAEAIAPDIKVPPELAFLREPAPALAPAPAKRGRRHVVAETEAPFGYKADGVTPRKRPAPSPSHQAALLAGRRNGSASKEPAHA